jgi:hypothetical protein
MKRSRLKKSAGAGNKKRMKVVGSFINRIWKVKVNGKEYTVDFMDSDFQTLALMNRGNWEVFDEEGDTVTDQNIVEKVVNVALDNWDDAFMKEIREEIKEARMV